MSHIEKKAWLTFEGGKQKQPCLWKMSRKFPEVTFDIRQTQVTDELGVMNVLFGGEQEDLDAAMSYLKELGVKVDPISE